MSTNAIIPISKLDISHISFVVIPAKNGRNSSISIKYDGQNLNLKLPRLAFPGGVLTREGDDGKTSYTLIGSLKGCDSYGKERANDADDTGRLYNFLKDLEERIIQAAVENSVKWFGKKRSEEGIREGFKPLMRLSVDKVNGEYVPNGKYPPSMTLKVPVYDGRVSMDIVDARGNPMYVNPNSLAGTFTKGSEIIPVVSASIYLMAGGGFGVTWRATMAQVFHQSRVSAASVFSDTIERDEGAVPAAPAQTETAHDDAPAEDYVIPENLEETAAPAPASAAAPARRRRAVPSSAV